MKTIAIAIDKEKIAEFCRRHHIEWLRLFGSVLRDDFGPESDVRRAGRVRGGPTPGWDFFGMEEELSGILGAGWT